MIHVVGGAYFERCLFPPWNQLFGSGGRAAALLAQAGSNVTFHTYASSNATRYLDTVSASYGFDPSIKEIAVTYAFDYAHPLSVPMIIPERPSMLEQPMSVAGQQLLRFGLLEGDAIVDAETAVYDPQSAFAPQAFEANGSRARRLAVVMNSFEALKIYDAEDVSTAIDVILKTAEVAIIKRGIHGAIVATTGARREVAAYESGAAFTIGSGDIFTATFFHFWALQGCDPQESADYASLAVAAYTESKVLPLLSPEVLKGPRRRELRSDQGASVYLAGPFFDLPQRWLVTEARALLRGYGLQVLSPLHDVGVGAASDVAPRDIEMLRQADKVFAILDGSDEGTLFEVGYARALDKPVVAYAQTLTEEQLKMVKGSGCRVVDDFAYALTLAAQK